MVDLIKIDSLDLSLLKIPVIACALSFASEYSNKLLRNSRGQVLYSVKHVE